jgi:hypothetical protein
MFNSFVLKKEAAGSYLCAKLHEITSQKTVVLKIHVFWDVMPHMLVNIPDVLMEQCRITNSKGRKQLWPQSSLPVPGLRFEPGIC